MSSSSVIAAKAIRPAHAAAAAAATAAATAAAETSLVASAIGQFNSLLEVTPLLTLLKNVIFVLVVLKYGRTFYERLFQKGPIAFGRSVILDAMKILFKYAKMIPFVQSKMKDEMDKTLTEMKNSVAPRKPGEIVYSELPSNGLNDTEVLAALEKLRDQGGEVWASGKVSGTVYHGGAALTNLITTAHSMFALSNPLHPDVFPGVRKMDAEVVAMTLHMFNGDSGEEMGCGTTTSGGTESILMACKTYRDWALETKGITEPEMLIPETAHAAFDKAGHYFGIRVVHIPVDEASRKVRVDLMKRAITRNTIMLVGSAPSFPHGVIDDIVSIAQLGVYYKIPVHVDSCLGGFLVPFMKQAGFSIPPFDFSVKGVTSISVDPHKYGFAPKGISVILYRNQNFRRFQYFVAADWPGGIYASPSIAGSRSGAVIAGCWAAMVRMGLNGYVESTKRIVGSAKKIEEALRNIPGVRLFGKPDVSVVGFGCKLDKDTYRLSEALSHKGWNLNTLQKPTSIHICCTYLTADVVDDFVRDVEESMEKINGDPEGMPKGMGAIYGMAASLPDRATVGDIAKSFIDILYST